MVMLDMSNVVDAIHVSSGATLEFVNITVSTLLLQHLHMHGCMHVSSLDPACFNSLAVP